MNHKLSNKPSCSLYLFSTVLLIVLFINACAVHTPDAAWDRQADLPVIEKWYSRQAGKMTIGIANRHNRLALPGSASIEANKQSILEMIDIFKRYDVNMILFPEFSLTGYFWKDTPACWDHMRKGVTSEHLAWLAQIKAKLDGTLRYVVFNNIRLNPQDPDGRFLNSTYVIDKDFDCTDLNSAFNEEYRIYDKTFLPGIEKQFTLSGERDRLILNTVWGKFGFATCYDMCFAQLFQEYAIKR